MERQYSSHTLKFGGENVRKKRRKRERQGMKPIPVL
jgi:hypothetical protein